MILSLLRQANKGKSVLIICLTSRWFVDGIIECKGMIRNLSANDQEKRFTDINERYYAQTRKT